jgi:hypothetical protein
MLPTSSSKAGCLEEDEGDWKVHRWRDGTSVAHGFEACEQLAVRGIGGRNDNRHVVG